MKIQIENQMIIPALPPAFKFFFGKSASEADIIAGQAKRRFLALRDFGNLDDEALDITLNKLASRVSGKVWARAWKACKREKTSCVLTYCPHLGGLKPPPLGGSFSVS